MVHGIRKFSRTPGIAVLLAILCACSSLPPAGPGAHQDARDAQRARAQALGLAGGDCAAPRWGMSGRVALSNGRDGGSGRIVWSQGAGTLHLELSAPVTRQSWTLDVGADGALLRGASAEPMRGADAADVLRAATGWEVPVAALGCWLRGVEADPAAFGPAQVAFADGGLPQRIAQGGWTIDYDGWKPDASSGLPMPARVTVHRGSDRLRLAVDRWLAE